MTIFCYQHHINDWRNDTAHLSLEERGAYREMMDAYYATEGHLPFCRKQIYRIIGVQTKSERKAIETVINQFFEEKDGLLFQKRCQEEISRIKERSEKAASSANAKYRKNNNIAPANAQRAQQRTQSEGTCERSANQEPITNNQEPLLKDSLGKTDPPLSYPPLFEKFWDVFPKPRRDSKNKSLPAYLKAIKRAPEVEIYEAACRYSTSDEATRDNGKYAKGTIAWLNGDRWTTQYQSSNRGADSLFGTTGQSGASSNGREPRGVVAAALRVAARLEEKDKADAGL